MKVLTFLTLAFTLMFSTLGLAGEREDTAWRKIHDGALVVDVRTDSEYAQGHLDNSQHIPYQQIVERFKALGIKKDREVVLYCRSGNRAGIAKQALQAAGYTNLFNGGGYQMLIDAKPAQ